MSMVKYEQIANNVMLRWQLGLMSDQERDNAFDQIVDDILEEVRV